MLKGSGNSEEKMLHAQKIQFSWPTAAETLRPADCCNPNWSKHVHVLALDHSHFLGLQGYVLIWHTGEQYFSASEY